MVSPRSFFTFSIKLYVVIPQNSSSNKESQYMLSLQNMMFFPGLFLTAPYLYIIIIFVHATIRSWDCWDIYVYS